MRAFRVGPDVVLWIGKKGRFVGGSIRRRAGPRPTARLRVPGTGRPLYVAWRLFGDRVRVWFDAQERVAAAQVEAR